MREPLISVIIPAFNQAAYLGEALQSVLDQTFVDFEVIIVDDGSRDGTREIVSSFSDPRVRYIAHPNNLGLPAAKNTGLRAAIGEIVAFLDADDLFHPDKLQAHVAFLREHPQVGVTYNARFEMDSSGNCLSIWRPPPTVSLADLVLGFPFNPSDMVLRREWALQVGLLDESYTFYGEDLDFNLRLALAGCRFAGIDRALNYRRYYPGKVCGDPGSACGAIVRALESAFSHPSCPREVLTRQEVALANIHAAWSYDALVEGDTALGQDLLRKAAELDPTLLQGSEIRFLYFLLHRSTQDGGDHEDPLRRVFARLPQEMRWLSSHQDWTIGRGYLTRGCRAAIWQRKDLAASCLERAAKLGARLDPPFLRFVLDQLLSYEAEMGARAAETALGELCRHLPRVGSQSDIRWLRSNYRISRAFTDYRSGHYARVPANVLKSVAAEPSYLGDHNLLALLAKSVVRALRQAGSVAITRAAR